MSAQQDELILGLSTRLVSSVRRYEQTLELAEAQRVEMELDRERWQQQVKLDTAVKDQTEAMPQPVQGGGAGSSTPAPPVDSHRHLFCTNHQSMAPVELNRCKEAYYREYSAYGQPCSLYPIESLILGDPAVKGKT